MNDKTREQIEAMKNQTIGVEIEMNNITREKAARKVAEYFGTRAWNAAGEYGYYSWACKDQQGRVWKFQRDVSIYGPDAEKCELVTPILTYDDIEPLQDIIRLLRKAGVVQAADAEYTFTLAKATTLQRLSETWSISWRRMNNRLAEPSASMQLEPDSIAS